MCGFSFDPASAPACPACPLNGSCQLCCCPNCGYQLVDVRRSWLASFFERHLVPQRRSHRKQPVEETSFHSSETAQTLVDITPGTKAQVIGFLPGMPLDRQTMLLAYGVAPGYWVRVVCHSPVTVLEVENTELALESGLARLIQVNF
jgi:Fe2+ transport system protein FeoA